MHILLLFTAYIMMLVSAIATKYLPIVLRTERQIVAESFAAGGSGGLTVPQAPDKYPSPFNTPLASSGSTDNTI